MHSPRDRGGEEEMEGGGEGVAVGREGGGREGGEMGEQDEGLGWTSLQLLQNCRGRRGSQFRA